MSTGKNNNYFHWWYIVVCILQRDLYILDVGLLSLSFLSIFQTKYVFIFYICAKRSFPHSRLIIGFVTRLARRVPLVEQELPTLPEHLSSTPVVSGVRVTRSLVVYVCFVDRCLSFCTFSFGHCVVCSSSIYGF